MTEWPDAQDALSAITSLEAERDMLGERLINAMEEITRINNERAALVRRIEALGGEHYARALDVVRAAQAFVDAPPNDEHGLRMVRDEQPLRDAVRAYERGE